MSHLSFSTQNLLRLVQSQSCNLSQSGFVQPAARNLKIFCLLSYQIKKSSKSSNTEDEINIIIDYSSRNKAHVQLIFHYIFHNTVRRSSSDFMSFTLHTDSLASFYLVCLFWIKSSIRIFWPLSRNESWGSWRGTFIPTWRSRSLKKQKRTLWSLWPRVHVRAFSLLIFTSSTTITSNKVLSAVQ